MADTSKPKEEKKSWHTLSFQEQQQRQLQKLFERVDKPIVLPEPKKEKSHKPPPDVSAMFKVLVLVLEVENFMCIEHYDERNTRG
ncbi:unnamed protein product [Umbelopsis ramanniana]